MPLVVHLVEGSEICMEQESERPAPLAAGHAFVVQFRTDTDVQQGHITGRVEHIISGQASHFSSLDDLLAFIDRVLTEVNNPPPP